MMKKAVSRRMVDRFKTKILGFYKQNARDLPWRHTSDPYHILVSEIMLQQTQVDRVIPKYTSFIQRFPDIHALASASQQSIVKAWQGLGYNRRALYLHRCARCIVDIYNGKIPEDPALLRALPGIGKATAASIPVFAYNKPCLFVETNIRTVFIHEFFDDRVTIDDNRILSLVEQTLDCTRPRIWYSALMDYGSYLKKRIPNPSRKSAIYKKQTQFKGSARQLRGMILRLLTEKRSFPEKRLAGLLGKRKEDILPIMHALEKEGFIQKKHSTYRLV